MKKVFAALAAGVMASAMALSLAACAEPEKSVVERAEEMASERIGSREAWEAAFADPTLGATDTSYTFNNANYSIESESVTMGGKGENGLRTVDKRVLTVADERVHRYENYERYTSLVSETPAQVITTDEYYVADESRYAYYVQNENDAWTMTTVSKLGISLTETAIGGAFTVYADEYDAFVWEEARQGYCKEVDTGSYTATLTLKFRDGKIAAMLITDSEYGEDASFPGLSTRISVVITYGGQHIDLPKI